MRRRDSKIEGGGATTHPHSQENIGRPPGLLRGAFYVGEQKVLWLYLSVQTSGVAQIRKVVAQCVVPTSSIPATRTP
jgi:hypothetical protein